jgi:DNA-binding NarL/FixJ family response regulator
VNTARIHRNWFRVDQLMDDATAASGAGRLSPRQYQCLQLLADGLSQPEIADRIGVSVGSVRKIVEAIYRKLGAQNAIDAIRRGVRLGIVQFP